MPYFSWIACMPVLTLSLATPAQENGERSSPIATGFLYKTVTFDKREYAYCVFVPPKYTPKKAWPVILFLHGSGERGQDGFRQTEVGLPQAIRRNHNRVPAIVVMPQCRRGQSWTGDMARLALQCVEKTSREYRLDKDRIYLTGLSLGGAGTWTIAAALPERFAAIAPICGFGDVRDAPKLAGVPVWCAHGALDDRVPVERSREMVAAVRAAGGDVTYKELPRGKHNVWKATYNDQEFWRWLFAQKRPTGDRERQRSGG